MEPIRGDGEEPRWLFAYGTLGPAGSGVGRPDWQPDRVWGRLYDLGPYPALVDWTDPNAGWVQGHVRPVERGELEQELDPYEGVAEGLFRRVVVGTAGGRRAWLYVYPHSLPAGARGPLTRWLPGGMAEPRDGISDM